MEVNLVNKLHILNFLLWILVAITRTKGRELNCDRDCRNQDNTNQNYRPQECAEKCKEVMGGKPRAYDDSDLEALEAKYHKLFIGVIVLAVLVAILIFLTSIIILKNTNLCSNSLKHWKKKKKRNEDGVNYITKHYAEGNGSRIANYAGQRKVSSGRMTNHTTHSTQRNEIPLRIPLSLQTKRVRRASEATCPDEDPEAGTYDNLALSQSRPSSPASPTTTTNVSGSTATLDTTVTTIQMDSVLGSPTLSQSS